MSTLHRGSRSRSTLLTWCSLLCFQLQGLVVRHPPSLHLLALLLTSNNDFTVLFLQSTSLSAIDTSISTPTSPEPRFSSCCLCLAFRLPCRSTFVWSSSQQYSLHLASHDVRRSFPVSNFATKLSHVPHLCTRRMRIAPLSLSGFASLSQQGFTFSHLLSSISLSTHLRSPPGWTEKHVHCTAGSGRRIAMGGTVGRNAWDMGVYSRWRTKSHRYGDVHGEDREGGSDGSYGEQDSGVSGLDEDLWWSRWCFCRTGWLHKGHQHCQHYISSCGRL
jgi:hypothetical protein